MVLIEETLVDGVAAEATEVLSGYVGTAKVVGAAVDEDCKLSELWPAEFEVVRGIADEVVVESSG